MTCMILQGMLAFGQIGVNTTFRIIHRLWNTVHHERSADPQGDPYQRPDKSNPVTSPATGLLVFNSGTNQAIGFYYWDGVHWVALGGGGSSGGDYWSLYGIPEPHRQ